MKTLCLDIGSTALKIIALSDAAPISVGMRFASPADPTALEKCVKEYYPGVEVKIEHAEGLNDCKKILLLAKAGKKNGCLIEGMACSGGCIAGAGTNIPIEKAAQEVKKFVENSTKALPPKDLYEIDLP